MKSEKGYHFAGIIPARYASTRFPGKPLVMIGDRTMIHRVYDQACKVLETVFVATDDERILNEVRSFGGNVLMTATDHPSGTDRCEEAARKIAGEKGFTPDIIINIQGDEPFIRPEQISKLMSCFEDPDVEIATLIRKTSPGEDIFNPNQPKVVVDSSGNALYFSRSVIPYLRDKEQSEWSQKYVFYKHI